MGLFSKKKKQQEPKPEAAEKMPEMDPLVRPGGVFMVGLLMKEPCEKPSLERMVEVLSRHVGAVEAFGSQPEGFSGFAALEHVAKFSDGEGPVLLNILNCRPFDGSAVDEMQRSQMWDCQEDRDEILDGCGYVVMANDVLGGGLPTQERANFVMDYVEALIELYPSCEAVHFLNSGKLVKPEAIRSEGLKGLDRYVRFAMNIRLFNVGDTEDRIMDTVGLSLLFIEDLQYHFHGMDPNWVVLHANSFACYVLKNDQPMKDGDTIDGVRDGELAQDIQWPCHFEDAMVQPLRAVLDVYMNEYAAGNR